MRARVSAYTLLRLEWNLEKSAERLVEALQRARSLVHGFSGGRAGQEHHFRCHDGNRE
jgi:hypothetical protein